MSGAVAAKALVKPRLRGVSHQIAAVVGDHDVAEVPGAFLHNLDDLTGIVSRNLQSRRAALPHAEAIIREAAADLSRWHLTRAAQQARGRHAAQSTPLELVAG